MEDTHGANVVNNSAKVEVLILIIMEDTHGGVKKLTKKRVQTCLNPYYNGRYSWSFAIGLQRKFESRKS